MFEKIFNIKRYDSNIRSVFLINFISVVAFQGVFSIFTGIHIKDLGYGEGVFGNILSINSIFIAIGSLTTTYLIKKFHFKRTLYLGFSILAIGMLGVGLSDSIKFLTLFSAFIGVGYSIPLTSINVLLNEFAPPNEKIQIFSTNFVLQNIGVVIGSYSAGFFINLLSSFIPQTMIFPTVYSLSFFFIIFSFFPISKLSLLNHFNKKSEISSNFLKDLKRVFKGDSLEFLKYNTLVGFGAGLVVPFFSVYLKFALHIDNKGVGTIMGISQLGLVIGGLIVPHLSKRLGRENTVILCQLLSIPFLLSITSFSSVPVVAFCFLMRSTLMNLNQPLIQNISMECVEQDLRPLLSSLLSMTAYFSRSISVILAGYIMEKISYNLPYYITVLFYLLGTGIFWKTFRKKKQPKTR